MNPTKRKKHDINRPAAKRLVKELSKAKKTLGEWCKSVTPEVEAAPEAAQGEIGAEYAYIEADEDHGALYFDPEDIQYAVDATISALIDEKLIKLKKFKGPSLAEVIRMVLGS